MLATPVRLCDGVGNGAARVGSRGPRPGRAGGPGSSLLSVEESTRVGPPAPGHPADNAAMRRLLFIPDGPEAPTAAAVERAFSASLALSGLRCIFTYMLLPVVAPVLGVLAGAAPVVGALLSAVAIVFDVRAIRTFWWAADPRRWLMTVLYGVVIVFLVYLLVVDLGRVHL